MAQDVLGIGWTGEAYKIDLATGNAISLGSSGASRFNAMAKAADGTMYAMADADLYTIDASTGAATYVATTSLSSVRGLAFDASGTLYAAENFPSTSIAEDILYTVDVNTGATSLIGATGVFGIQGMCFSGGTLYAWEIGNGSGTGMGLVTIDTATAVTTDVNPAVNGTGSEGQCLFADASGQIYCASSSLYKVDSTTGATSLVGGGGFSVRGAEIIGASGPSLSVSNLAAGSTATVSVSAAGPNAVIFAAYSLNGGGPTSVGTPWGTFSFDLTAPYRRLPTMFANGAGNASQTQNVPGNTTGTPVWVHALVVDQSGTSAETTNSLALTIQ